MTGKSHKKVWGGGTLHGMELWNCLAAGVGEDMGEEH